MHCLARFFYLFLAYERFHALSLRVARALHIAGRSGWCFALRGEGGWCFAFCGGWAYDFSRFAGKGGVFAAYGDLIYDAGDWRWGVMRIEAVNETNFDVVLPLIGKYQSWYKKVPDAAQNARHFRRFWHHEGDLAARAFSPANPPPGLQFVLYDVVEGSEKAIGFATLYFPFSSTRAIVYCLMNDLFVDEGVRGKGYGRALIRHCLETAHRLGFPEISWTTAQTNERAQRLYDSTGAHKSAWYEYDLEKM